MNCLADYTALGLGFLTPGIGYALPLTLHPSLSNSLIVFYQFIFDSPTQNSHFIMRDTPYNILYVYVYNYYITVILLLLYIILCMLLYQHIMYLC